MKYVLRAVKYLVKLVVMLVLVFVLMQMSGTSNIESDGGILGFFESFFATGRGRIFAVALLVWCAVYPAVEFKKRHLSYDLSTRKNAIVRALNAGGMTLAGEGSEQKMVFTGSMFRRVWYMGDDAVTITRSPEGGIDIEGPRRFVIEAEHRIPNYVEAEKENENE